MRGVQMRRPSLYDIEAEFRAMQTPVLVMVGVEDDHCLQPGVFLKRTISRSGLTVFPKTGHTLNFEEPELFNRHVAELSRRWKRAGGDRASPCQSSASDAHQLTSECLNNTSTGLLALSTARELQGVSVSSVV
jgi:hypothetical protein